ncbi:hypothetical protein [Kineococcus arenarius]|uniref:hypothetical protein n=1 Tax=Kineococcus sp. SYSU DK007 TaxID=3383128 RepID=UPI003D7F168E
MRTARWWRRSGAAGGEEAELHLEVERLRRENARLQLERQRPRSISEVTEQLRGTLAGHPALLDALEAQDDAYHVMAHTEATRRALVDVLDELTVAAAQMKRQLGGGLPLAEIDRRVVERRGPRGSHVAERPTDHGTDRRGAGSGADRRSGGHGEPVPARTAAR